MLEAKNLSVRYGSLAIVDNISFSVVEGEWLMIVGPNGAGKSTLLGAVSRGIAHTGQVLLKGRDFAAFRAKEAAAALGMVMQSYHVGYSFTVEEVVRLGRYAYGKGVLSAPGEDDDKRVREALEITGLTGLRGQGVTTLSGGELQRTFLAQVLAQNPAVILLDEPTSHLDLVFQKQVFQMLQGWLEQPGRALVSVVHDLSLAKAYGSHALLMDKGKTVAIGPVKEVLSAANLGKVYQMDVYGWMKQMLGQWEEEQ